MSFFVLPYALSSQSGKDLANALNAKRIRPERSSYRYRTGDSIVNWGSARPRPYPISLNHPKSVAKACNKLLTFDALDGCGIRVPVHTTDPGIAHQWLEDGVAFYARRTEGGSRGSGLYPPSATRGMDRNDLHSFRMFTKATKNVREFRVHAFAYGPTLVHEKKRRNGHRDTNLEIRNHANNWVFCQNDLAPFPNKLQDTAIQSIRALGLNFGAVDCCLDNDNEVTVFEINTAPGLETRTKEWYANTIREIFQ